MIITKRITSTYTEIPFEIEGKIDNLLLESKISKHANLFIFLYNPDNVFIGEISYSHNKFIHKIYFSSEKTTMNGLAHKLVSGKYKLVVFCEDNMRQINDLNVEFNIDWSLSPDETGKVLSSLNDSFFQEKSWFDGENIIFDSEKIHDRSHRYYKGDLHGHTFYSDGQLDGSAAGRILQEQKMDFMTLTDHNRIPFGFKEMNTLNIPSFELTSPIGHINIHGIKKTDLFKGVIEDLDSMEGFLDKAVDVHMPHANISLNHIFLDIWRFTDEDFRIGKVNTVELICDPTYPTSPAANDKTVSFMDFLWNKGHRLYGVGGSDSHNLPYSYYPEACKPSIYGDPSTYVYCQGLSADNLLNGIKNGNSYISRFVELDISINDKDYLPGDEVISENDFEYMVRINNFDSPDVDDQYMAKFIMNGKEILLSSLDRDNPEVCLTNISSTLMEEEYWWLRFGLYDSQGHAVVYVNPVYCGEKECMDETVTNLMKEFEEDYDKGNTI